MPRKNSRGAKKKKGKIQTVRIVGRRTTMNPKLHYRNIIKPKWTGVMRYVTSFSLNPSGVAGVSHSIRANGMFDPDASGIGHQPLGFDQYMGVLYDHYTVKRSTIRATFFSTSDAGNGSAIVGIQLGDSSTAVTTLDTMLEQDKTNWKPLTARSAYGVTTINNSFNAKKFFALNDLNNARYQGSATADPTEQAFFHVVAQGVTGNDPDSIRVIVEVNYEVELREPKELQQS